MAKKGKVPDMNLPIWFDGQNINKALFCEEFLHERRIIFANNKIDEMLKQPNCPFVLYVGTKKLVKRKAFEEFIESKVAI